MRFSFRKKNRDQKQTHESVQKERPLRFAEIQDRKKRQQRMVRLVLIAGVFLAVCIATFLLRSFLTVRSVSCFVQTDTCDEALTSSSQVLIGKNMLEPLTISHAYLDVAVKRQWPNTARVTFTKPELLVTFTPSVEGKAPVSLTTNGIVVSFVMEQTSMPAITDLFIETKQQGEHIDEKRLKFYKELLPLLGQLRMEQIRSITIVDDQTVIFSVDSDTQVITDTVDIAGKLETLQTLLDTPTIDRRGKTIDLRFQNPVIK